VTWQRSRRTLASACWPGVNPRSIRPRIPCPNSETSVVTSFADNVEVPLPLRVRALRCLRLRAACHAAARAVAERADGARYRPGHGARGDRHGHDQRCGGGHPHCVERGRLRRLHHPDHRPWPPRRHHRHPRRPRRGLSVPERRRRPARLRQEDIKHHRMDVCKGTLREVRRGGEHACRRCCPAARSSPG